MGGYLSVAYTEQYPAAVERLILMVPAGVQDSSEELSNKQKKKSSLSSRIGTSLWNAGIHIHIEKMMQTLLPQRIGKHWANQSFGNYMSTEERRLMTDYMHANVMLPLPPVHKLFRADSTAHAPLCHRIPKLLATSQELHSVNFIYAERDTWMKVEYGLNVQQRCAITTTSEQVTVCVVKDAGHALNFKHPQAFCTAVAVAAGMDIATEDKSLLPIMY
jgi:pimeloyl-ACP methyl ester carboxylesterase